MKGCDGFLRQCLGRVMKWMGGRVIDKIGGVRSKNPEDREQCNGCEILKSKA